MFSSGRHKKALRIICVKKLAKLRINSILYTRFCEEVKLCCVGFSTYKVQKTVLHFSDVNVWALHDVLGLFTLHIIKLMMVTVEPRSMSESRVKNTNPDCSMCSCPMKNYPQTKWISELNGNALQWFDVCPLLRRRGDVACHVAMSPSLNKCIQLKNREKQKFIHSTWVMTQ